MSINYESLITSDRATFIVFLVDSSLSMKKYLKNVSDEFKSAKSFFISLEDRSVILILRADFSGSYRERKICRPNDFQTDFSAEGKSILYYSICRIAESLLFPNEGYLVKAEDAGFNIRTILFTISDGKDEGSKKSGYYFNEAKEALSCLKEKNVETHLLLFGSDDNESLKLGFDHVHSFSKDNEGLSNMFETIKSCSKDIVDNINFFEEV